MRLDERAGVAIGRAIAPLFRATSALRGARTFHPRGDLARAEVTACAGELDRMLAERLTGPALVRLSSALARTPRWPDVLGCAIRFGENQDVLFATIKRPWTMPFAPLTTHVHDYLANHYFAVSPFVFHGKRLSLRLRPMHRVAGSGMRAEKLDDAIASGRAELALEIGPTPRGPWRPLAIVRLVERLHVDPPNLTFDPFRNGKGLRPMGFVHALRRGVYAASRRARVTARSSRSGTSRRTCTS